MRSLRSKKNVILILSVLLLILCFVLAFIAYNQFFNHRVENTEEFTTEINNQLLEFDGYFNDGQVKEALNKINNESLPRKDRFEALKDLSFYFASAYSTAHDPKLRENSKIVKTFAAKNFPEFYKDDSGVFEVSCSDTTCGDKPDAELLSIKDEILKLNIESKYLDTIAYNLEQSMYIPKENIDEKMYGFNLVISQLEVENTKEASATAKKLKDYVETNYHVDENH